MPIYGENKYFCDMRISDFSGRILVYHSEFPLTANIAAIDYLMPFRAE
jgi:hypothetical protein